MAPNQRKPAGTWSLEPSPNGRAPDSYSGRLTFAPTKNVAAQYSIAHITAPEALTPNQNQRRQTASVMLNRPLTAGNFAVTALWGQTKSLPANSVANSYLLEALLNRRRNYLWTRIELAARTTDLLSPAPPAETTIGHVQAYTLGYDRDYHLGPLRAAPGAQLTAYHSPHPLYGSVPYSAVLFLRFRLSRPSPSP